MNTRRIQSTVGAHAPLIVLLAVMATTAPAVYTLAVSIFKDSPLRQVALIGVSELGLILWHLAHAHSKGAKQDSIANVMTWLSLLGVVALAGLEIILETSRSGQVPIKLDVESLGTIIIVGLVALIAAHLVGAISFMGADTDKLLAKAEALAEFKIKTTSIRAREDAAELIAAELAKNDAADYIVRKRAQRSANLIGGMAFNASAPAPAAQLSAPAQATQPVGTVSPELIAAVIAAVIAAIQQQTTPADDGKTKS